MNTTRKQVYDLLSRVRFLPKFDDKKDVESVVDCVRSLSWLYNRLLLKELQTILKDTRFSVYESDTDYVLTLDGGYVGSNCDLHMLISILKANGFQFPEGF